MMEVTTSPEISLVEEAQRPPLFPRKLARSHSFDMGNPRPPPLPPRNRQPRARVSFPPDLSPIRESKHESIGKPPRSKIPRLDFKFFKMRKNSF